LSTYLRPTAAIAADVLLPGDPAVALSLAQELLEKPLMANHSYGLWGYSGRTNTGRELTIQATGIGGPSAAAVLGELAAQGVRRAIAIGRCRALDPGLEAGTLAVATGAVGADGMSRTLGITPTPDPGLTTALARHAQPAISVTVLSVDSLGELRGSRDGAAVADLEAAALLALAARLGLQAAAGLVVAEPASGEPDEEATQRALTRLGVAATVALAEAQAPASATPSPS